MPLCELVDVTKTYGTGAALVHALDHVSVTIESGEFTVFSGPSGSGKTTLLNMIGCLDVPTSGRILLEGREVEGLPPRELAAVRARRIGFIFQSFNLIPVLTAVENVELALHLAGIKEGVRARSAAALEQVGLGDLLHRRPTQLSGGQQQRVAVARALVKQPALVIADEPTANLDSATGQQVLEVMRDMNATMGVTFLFSTHDKMVMDQARRVVVLRDGQVVEDRRAAATA